MTKYGIGSELQEQNGVESSLTPNSFDSFQHVIFTAKTFHPVTERPCLYIRCRIDETLLILCVVSYTLHSALSLEIELVV